jgi:hypothetical protein
MSRRIRPVGRAAANDSHETSPPDELDEFLAYYPGGIARQSRVLHDLILRTVPAAKWRIRPGWRLIGYDLPVTRHGTFFAWVWPETEHVHLGFEVGTLMDDPDRVLRGAHLKLKKVRYFTFESRSRVPVRQVTAYVREAVRIASLSRGERDLLRESAAEGVSTNGP